MHAGNPPVVRFSSSIALAALSGLRVVIISWNSEATTTETQDESHLPCCRLSILVHLSSIVWVKRYLMCGALAFRPVQLWRVVPVFC